MLTRADIIRTARGYLGTPFRHQGRIKGLALDCVGLVLCVADDLHVVDGKGQEILRDDYKNYTHQPVDTLVFDTCCERLVRKMDINSFRPGDVLSLRYPLTPTHVAIVSELNGELYMIHAHDSGPRTCVEHILDRQWRRRIAGVFEFPGVID